jgi:hypothetical protein
MTQAGDEHARALADEARRVRQLRTIVDLTTSLLVQQPMERDEAERLVAAARRRVLELFPDKEETYELILAPRFARLLVEFVGPAAATRVLPFRRP